MWWYRCAGFVIEMLTRLAARSQALTDERFWRMPSSPPRAGSRNAPDLTLARRVGAVPLQSMPHQQQFALKAALRDRGLSRNGWKFFCHYGQAVCWPLRHWTEFRTDPIGAIALHANLYAAIGRAEAPPRALVLALGRMRSCGWFDSGAHRMRAAAHLALAAWTVMDQLPDTDQREQFAQDSLMQVADWWLNEADTLPVNRDWEWLAGEAESARRRAFLARSPCVTFGSPQQIFEHRVLPLRTFGELRDAGLSLHNCMCEAKPARTPVHAHFLIVDADDSAVAMFRAFPPLANAVAEEVLGPQNQPVPDYIEFLATLYMLHEKRSGIPADLASGSALEQAMAA